VPPAHPVLEGSLPRRRRLGERGRATERPRQSVVVDAEDAHVGGAADGAAACHPLGHLHFHLEVGGGGRGETADAESRDVLDHLGLLEGLGIGAARGWVDHCGEGTGAVLVDLFI